MTLRQLFSTLRGHVAIIICLPLCCALIAYGVASVIPKHYKVQRAVEVPISQDNPDFDRNAAAKLTYVGNGERARNVLHNLIEEIPVDDYVIEVQAPPKSNVLTIGVSGMNEAEATAIADTLAQYIYTYATHTLLKKSVKVIDEGPDTETIVTPKPPMYAIEFAVFGLLVAVAIATFRSRSCRTSP